MRRPSHIKHQLLSLRHHSTKNYSATLQLPTTNFSPKIPSGEFAEKILTTTTKDLYQWQKTRHKNGSSNNNSIDSKFILHDGPPYANGDLHLGHALNKVLKDMINRYEMVYNDKVIEYVPGWDCHGLPIELKVSKPGLLALEIRTASRNVANEMIDKQKAQFKEYGIMTDWNDIYKTMDHQYEINQLSIFQQLIDNNLLTRQLKPVWYGVDTKTALAEAELEYKEHKSIAIYVKFKLTPESIDLIGDGTNISLLIWTSTPWTLLGNRAICMNKNLNYVKLSNGNELVIVAEDLVESIKLLNPEFDQVSPFDDSNLLLSLKYINPLTNEICPVLHGDHVTNSAGTGLVHTAPAHGMEDYLIGLDNNLEIKSIVNEEGIFINKEFPQTPVNRIETTKELLKIYFNNQMIHKVDYKFIHNYPYDWRSKTPVIQQATPQWFINVEKINKYTIEAINSVEFIPEIGINRLKAFINNRSEWCISRQRSWGVPIPIIYYKNEPIYEIIDYVILKLDEFGTDEWFKDDANNGDDILKWLPIDYVKDHNLDVKSLSKGKDTMDVWFDSGTSWKILPEGTIADVYLEGSDQHRGWFQSSLLNKVISTGNNGQFQSISPFKKIVTHGFILDKKSDKMSKSKGNVVSPKDLIQGNPSTGIPKLGVDGLRLWIASSNYVNDIAISNEILKRVLDNLRKFRVTFKYLLGNLNDLNTCSGAIGSYEDLCLFDKYVLSSLKHLQINCQKNYQEYNFQKVLKDLSNNMNNTLSALYFDVSKDCLYTDGTNSKRRRNIQFVLQQVLKTYIGILSPIVPCLTQEVWYECKDLFNKSEVESPSMMSYGEFYKLPDYYYNEVVENQINELLKMRTAVFNKFEGLRKSGLFKKNLELMINITTSNSYVLENSDILDDIFLVSKLTITKPTGVLDPTGPFDLLIETFSVDDNIIEIYRSDDHKCPRCWKFNSKAELELCHRCHEVVNN